jgi:8-oxo-dGTP pyrophosphatase MutT (NUDIX family)
LPGFRKLGEKKVYGGHLIEVALGTFATPDGEEFEREVVHHPGAVVIVPVHDDGRVTLVRQYRAAIESDLLELPAGKRDVSGEDPEVTARRELAEEAGLRAGHLQLVGRFYNSAGFSDELSWVYVATDLEECATDFQGIEESHMTIEKVALSDFPTMVTDGRIVDAKTIIGMALASTNHR